MRFLHRVVPVMLIGAVALGAPIVASAAWNFGNNGPHRVKAAEPEGPPQEERSLAPKSGVAFARPSKAPVPDTSSASAKKIHSLEKPTAFDRHRHRDAAPALAAD